MEMGECSVVFFKAKLISECGIMREIRLCVQLKDANRQLWLPGNVKTAEENQFRE